MTYIEKDPLIRQAQLLQEKYEPLNDADGAMILFLFAGEIIGGASYGKTKPLCRRYGKLLDFICNLEGDAP
jgi:hypothetical protein